MIARTKLIPLVFATLTLAGLLSLAEAQLVGQLGVLDVENANGGINPATGAAWVAGDTYRLAFHTEDKRDASSADIADYNTFVNTVADGSLAFPNLGDADWKVLGSTADVSARENTSSTDLTPGVGAPVFVLDGVTLIAVDNADMWNGWSNGGSAIRIDTGDIDTSPHYSPYLNEEGAGDTGIVHGVDVATGSNSGGVQNGTDTLGGPNGRVAWGSSNGNRIGRVWGRFGSGNPDSSWSFYALSEPLMVLNDSLFQPFAITAINHDPDANTVTLTWRKTGADLYIAKYSVDMGNWDFDMADDLTEANDENMDDPDTITFTFDLSFLPLVNPTELFFRIEENSAG